MDAKLRSVFSMGGDRFSRAGDRANRPCELVVHGSCVAISGRGLLILGPSGSGKSALALQLMAYGAALVSDDGTRLIRRDEVLLASAPDPVKGRIEARGIGLLAAETSPPVPLAAAVDLGRIETERLPQKHTIPLLGLHLPLILNSPGLSFASALLQYLKGSRYA